MDQDLSWDIIQAIASRKNVEPSELDIIIGDHIDLGAVSRLADHNNATWTLRFELPENSVTVTSDGMVLVDDQPERNWT